MVVAVQECPQASSYLVQHPQWHLERLKRQRPKWCSYIRHFLLAVTKFEECWCKTPGHNIQAKTLTHTTVRVSSIVHLQGLSRFGFASHYRSHQSFVQVRRWRIRKEGLIFSGRCCTILPLPPRRRYQTPRQIAYKMDGPKYKGSSWTSHCMCSWSRVENCRCSINRVTSVIWDSSYCGTF